MRSELKINLKSLSNQGWDFSYNQKSAELTKKLRPLIGENSYNIRVCVRPSGHSSYIISGQIQTWFNLLCARCAYEFKESINKEFEEKIFLQKKLIRIDKRVRNSHFSELMNTEDFTVINDDLFDIGEFLHELIAVEEPLRPLGAKTCDDNHLICEHLENMKQKIKQKSGRGQIHFSQNA